MGTKDSENFGSPRLSIAPETEDIDASWDDEPEDVAVGDDPDPSPYDRATVIPEIPQEQLAAHMMDGVDSQPVPKSNRPTPQAPSPGFAAGPPDEYLSPPKVPIFAGGGGLPQLPNSAPPAAPVQRGGVSLDRGVPELAEPTAKGPGESGGLTESLLPTAQASQQRPAVQDQTPPTGLELDLEVPRTADDIATQPPLAAAEVSLELDTGSDYSPALELADRRPRESQRPPESTGEAELIPLETEHSRTPPPSDDGDALKDMKDRYAVGDFTGALVIAESILESSPEDTEAKRYAQSCREVLTQMYAARLGALDQVVAVAIPADQIRWLSLDHRAGFLLSLVDGMCTIEDILDVSGMSRLDALRIMFTLVQQRVISLRPQ